MIKILLGKRESINVNHISTFVRGNTVTMLIIYRHTTERANSVWLITQMYTLTKEVYKAGVIEFGSIKVKRGGNLIQALQI
jgi:hypothetical protein